MKDNKLFILACVAALCFNNWLLGFVLNPDLIFKGGAVSELSAAGQPYLIIFRSLDIVSGILFIAIGTSVLIHYRNCRSSILLGLATITLGVSNTVDALKNLPCSETLTKACAIPVDVSNSHFTIPQHGYSSVAVALCYLLLPLAGLFYGRRINSRRIMIISGVLLSLAACYIIASTSEYIITKSFTEKAKGPSQEIQMLLLGIWFVIWTRSYKKLPIKN